MPSMDAWARIFTLFLWYFSFIVYYFSPGRAKNNTPKAKIRVLV